VTPAATDDVRELLAQSLIAWRLAGRVTTADDGALVVACDGHTIRVARAQPRLPFRWMVTVGDRARGAISLVAVLRQVRAALDPGYATMRARVTAFPLVPP
jgi:hypothetical protein